MDEIKAQYDTMVLFYPCCGMQSRRTTRTTKNGTERVRQRKTDQGKNVVLNKISNEQILRLRDSHLENLLEIIKYAIQNPEVTGTNNGECMHINPPTSVTLFCALANCSRGEKNGVKAAIKAK